MGACQLVRQDGWQAAICGGHNRPRLLMVATELAGAFLPARCRPTVDDSHVVGAMVVIAERAIHFSGTKATWPLSPAKENRGPQLRRAFLLPNRSLVKCIRDRPMHAGAIVMALRRVASRDIKNPQGPEPSVRPSTPRR